MSYKKDESYNVDNYTDEQLMTILDLHKPEDRELEERVLFLVNKYTQIGNEGSKRLAQFFIDVYYRFFEPTDKEDLDTEEDSEEDAEEDIEEQDTEEEPESELNIVEGMDNMDKSRKKQSITTYNSAGDEVQADISYDEAGEGKTQIQKTVAYAKDKLNPLLNQTIRRIVSIDSQYRENKSTASTFFTFNLSEPLKDVVSLKLYSVQIPFTWYTINTSFGGNFFYIRGNSPGIDTGTHDYKVSIQSGNYTPDNLVLAINSSIETMSKLPQYADVNFGKTGISYYSPTSLSTMQIDITKIYNEGNYYLDFPDWSSPLDIVARKNTLAGYLGYNYTAYNCSTIYSTRDLPLINTSSTSADNVSSIYTVDASNSSFKIVSYTGTTYLSQDMSINVIIDVELGLPYGNYSRNAIVAAVSSSFILHPELDTNYTFLERTDIDNVEVDSVGNSYFQMHVKLDRLNTPNILNSDTVIIFPDETAGVLAGQYPIWTGATSCFHFQELVNDCNTIVSETNTLQTNYIISAPNIIQINLECVLYPYNVPYNTYIIPVPQSNATGFLLTDLLTNINGSIQAANVQYSISSSHDDLNYPNTSIYLDPYTNFMNFSVDMNRVFRNSYYHFTSQHTYLGTFDVDLSDNVGVFTNVFPISSAYVLTPADVLSIIPKASIGFVQNVQDATFRLAPAANSDYSNYQDLQRAINNMFINYEDEFGDRPFQNTRVVFAEYQNFYVRSTLRLTVNKSLSQLDYNANFVDTSVSQTANNFWVANLYFNPTYHFKTESTLTGSISTIINNRAISDNQILIQTGINDTFSLKPYPDIDGLYTEDEDYAATIIIPPGTYSRNTLYNIINTLFAENPLTFGTTISVYSKTGLEYTQLRVYVNKVFTTKDYKVVFYDALGFSSCNPGSNQSIQNATWDTTVGWILGFRETPVYYLGDYTTVSDTVPPSLSPTKLNYYNSQSPNSCVMIGDTCVSVNLFNYFLIVLNDYTQSHLNDGLVTTAMPQTELELSSGTTFVCDPITGEQTISTVPNDGTTQGLTSNQIYANNQKYLSMQAKKKSYSVGPFVKDVFGIIPMKLTGLQPSQVYVEFGGTLQNQERVYFGPVNINRMTIQLMSDRGDLVDLNNANWSFSLMCEQLYKV